MFLLDLFVVLFLRFFLVSIIVKQHLEYPKARMFSNVPQH